MNEPRYLRFPVCRRLGYLDGSGLGWMIAGSLRRCHASSYSSGERSSLWQMAARMHQAALAANEPERWCAQGPSMRSDQTVSQMAWRRWVKSASVVGSVLLVKNGW